jgi:pimeloyl-ACP methyl ester carboxylesterase
VLTSIAAFLAIVVIGVPLFMYLMQDRLLFFPQPISETARGEVKKRFTFVQDLTLEAEGTKLHAWHVPAAPGKPLVLYFGGNAEEVSWMIPDARARAPGMGWLLINYRGYGGSGGAPSEASISADALRWHDHAVKELGASRVIVFGRSLGSGAAVAVAAQRKVAGAILVTPFDSLVEVAGHHYPFLPVRLLLRHPFDSVKLAPHLQVPLLCIAATRDEVIPMVHARRLFDAWAGPKQWLELPGANHNSTDGMPAFWPAITAFLQQ